MMVAPSLADWNAAETHIFVSFDKIQKASQTKADWACDERDTNMKLHKILAVCAALMILLLPMRSTADTLSWTVSNQSSSDAAVAFFYSRGGKIPEHRDGIVIDAGSSTHVELQCERGEEICFGAWDFDDEGEWGAGRNNDLGCSTCCAICSNGSKLDNLYD